MPDSPVRENALQFFYFGFHHVLRRFRVTVIAGWCIAGAGGAALAFRWGPLWEGDLAGGILCALLIVAGVLLVQQGVTELSNYVQVPFPSPPDTEEHRDLCSAVGELSLVMKEVEEGGWQDALQALAAVRAIGERYGLPEPGGLPRPIPAEPDTHT
jgi:hypothetical protein